MIGVGYVDFFCRSYASPPHSIVLDIDDTDDLVHGGQQLALFSVHAGSNPAGNSSSEWSNVGGGSSALSH